MKQMHFRGVYFAGRFEENRRGEVFLKEDPGDLDVPVGRWRADPSVVDRAVAAARAALPVWRKTTAKQRLAALRRLQRLFARRREELAWVMSRETGKPLAESNDEVTAMIAKVDVTVAEALPLVAERSFPMEGGSRGVIRYRPRGVVGVVGPFNVPGHLPNGQIVPALLTGNTVVFKPSEEAPFTGQLLTELLHEAGLPPGVFNMVPGGGDVGARLAEHPDVNALFFTGSAATGARVQAAAAPTGKLVALEMGGKNAALVLPDAPLERAIREIVHGAFATSGQRCSSTSRVLVHRDIAADFLPAFLAAVDRLTIGYFTEGRTFGPLINEAAVARFLRAQKDAARAGFQTLREGHRRPQPRRGHYVGPSVHLLEEGARVWARRGRRPYGDEELFAPDVAIYIMKDEDEMVVANNASRYGLVTSVFSRSPRAFQRLVPRLETGVVHWNRTTAMTPGRLPFGGWKASGNHWPAGLFAIHACVAPTGSVETPAEV